MGLAGKGSDTDINKPIAGRPLRKRADEIRRACGRALQIERYVEFEIAVPAQLDLLRLILRAATFLEAEGHVCRRIHQHQTNRQLSPGGRHSRSIPAAPAHNL